MITVLEKLATYCEENNIKMPPAWVQSIVGKKVLQRFIEKNEGKYVQIDKISIQHEFEVNAYPDDFSGVITDTIKDWHTNKYLNFKELMKKTKPDMPTFAFSIPLQDTLIFEQALTEGGIKIKKEIKADITQYHIKVNSPTALINLGISYKGKMPTPRKRTPIVS